MHGLIKIIFHVRNAFKADVVEELYVSLFPLPPTKDFPSDEHLKTVIFSTILFYCQ